MLPTSNQLLNMGSFGEEIHLMDVKFLNNKRR